MKLKFAGLGTALSLAVLLTTGAAWADGTTSWHMLTGSIRAGLAVGDAGQPVRILQGDLYQLGYDPGAVDGFYGVNTKAAVKRFQAAHGEAQSGSLDRATYDSLLKAGGWQAPATGNTATQAAVVPAGKQVLQMVATAYGPNYVDNYPYGPVDYYGKPLRTGVVAVDPTVIPLGTRLWVGGYRSPFLPAGGFEAIAADTGGAIHGNRMDIFIDAARRDVSTFGIQKVSVTVLGR